MEGDLSDISDILTHVSDTLSPSEEALIESWFRSWSTPSDNEMLDIIERLDNDMVDINDRFALDGSSYANGFLIEASVVEEEDSTYTLRKKKLNEREDGTKLVQGLLVEKWRQRQGDARHRISFVLGFCDETLWTKTSVSFHIIGMEAKLSIANKLLR
ncbi:hypothetical protein DCAR_0520183 [Daucus carota subsp. sativus]|uniref:Uncharacterized protein n=1 Tax=Daucus carota subsp. sativus TaxID=79200 RepID=A0A162A2W3_DAUCS|nr:hypothetical protein DCAR_0520183 [Daucus carota subsp. sativus]